MKCLRVADLPVESRDGLVLRCAGCDENWSALRGDYFTLNPAEELRCQTCNWPLQLAVKSTEYKYVSGEYLK